MLKAKCTAIDREIAVHFASDEVLTAQVALMTSVMGIGQVVTATLVARLPELGTCSGKHLASLVGVAPHPRWTWHLPSRPLHGHVVSEPAQPVVTSYYRRIRLHKPHKVAIIACLPRLPGILTIMVHDGLTWDETRVAHALEQPQTP